jgi:two-component system sensor histidine kinase VicK
MNDELETLKKENEELKKLCAVRSDWVSISAHELRTSLAANKWILKMFLDKDFGEITTEQAGFMQKAFDATEHMISLVSDMITANHTQDAVLEYKFEQGDIVKMIEDVIFDFHGESFKKGVEVIFLKPNPLPAMIKMDTGKIRVVIQNLVENALKYSQQGETVIVSVTEKDGMLQVSVKDQGIGIPLDEQSKIFEKFYRATNAKAKEEIGSGLGLYMTKSIVESHGGKLWFDSIPNTGTTFYASLPR